MFLEMHLTVNEAEKMAIGEKIKFCQVLATAEGGKKAGPWGGHSASAPHTVSVLLPGALPATGWCMALRSDPETTQNLGSRAKVLVRPQAAGYRTDWQPREAVIREEKEKRKTCSKIFGLL